MPGPMDTVAKRSAMRCSSSSCTRSSTSSRDPAEQVCPAFCKIAFADHGGRPLDVRVAEHQVGRLAAELQRHRRHPLGGRARDQAADLGRADEAEVVDARVGGQRGPGLRPEPGDHVDHAGRQARLGGQPGEVDRRARRLVGRLEHRAVPGGDGGRHPPAEQLHRVVPGDDVAGDAERLAAGVHVQVRPQRDAQAVVRLDDAAVEAEVARAHPGVVARLRQRLAAVLALQPGERLDLAVNQAGQRRQQIGPLLGGGGPPAAAGAAGRRHGLVDLAAPRPRHIAEGRAGRRVNVRVRLGRAHRRPVDEGLGGQVRHGGRPAPGRW